MLFNVRYGSYYINQMINLDKNYPGMKEYLEKGGFSIQAQDHHAIRTATDQRGEQTINKDAKTPGMSLVVSHDKIIVCEVKIV